MNSKALSFLALMLTVAMIALVVRFALLHVINLNVASNEANAQDTLRLLSTALENYARDHLGVFPNTLASLLDADPPYIEKEYVTLSFEKGYNFDCSILESTGYTCTAFPAQCGLSGKIAYTITTGGSMISEECSKQE